jgi:acyl-CoA thioesterase YciA
MPTKEKPTGELAIKVVAMPADTNPAGDVFGGWIMSQMDLAGGMTCRKIVRSRVVTVAINSIVFKRPVFVGDTLCCYVKLIKIGNTSISVRVEAWVNREFEKHKNTKVTEGDFVYVKVDNSRKPVSISK